MRPTRDETRRRLVEAAATVFANKGIGDATIDDIAAAAGFTKGAFYSNFDSKDTLVTEMLDEHLRASVEAFESMLREHREAGDLLGLLRAPRDRRDTAIDRSTVLYTEYVLYAARTEAGRDKLRQRLTSARQSFAEALTATAAAFNLDLPIPADAAADLLLAFDDGFGLHMVIDPTTATTQRYDQIILSLVAAWAATASQPGD